MSPHDTRCMTCGNVFIIALFLWYRTCRLFTQQLACTNFGACRLREAHVGRTPEPRKNFQGEVTLGEISGMPLCYDG